MTLTQTKVEKRVVKEWETATALVCDQCGASVAIDPPVYGKDRPDPTGWMVLKSWDTPPWYDLECKNATVRHFDSLHCLAQWAAGEAAG